MKKLSFYSFLIFFASLSSCASGQFNIPDVSGLGLPKTTGSTNRPLTEAEVANGLKEALIQGTSKGTAQASQTNGYYGNSLIRIPFPPEIQKVETTLRNMGMGSEVDKFVVSLNRAAEDAATSAKPIFISAIKSLTIRDVWNILRGEKDAATQYLKRTTTPQLTASFKPIIQKSLDKVNATKHYGTIITAYNKVPLVQKVNPDLNAYATDKAIAGLFTLVAQEEANIRENPIARTTELLKRVFGSKG
ncbi:DUF4197 domain-containing protein [Adhaeribacter soli]|uniref:DUF4197 domain-containing protein n=1 Tax=Adhaeribacter soli TaxID=2607655 RepID=A0A5N1J251_9BACT|nr:DUF4197 domain-containing protein [Adhaeribacter soli]KAA9340576.1 DUF4197 domain-containing protein [Adhaeribacter soli]